MPRLAQLFVKSATPHRFLGGERFDLPAIFYIFWPVGIARFLVRSARMKPAPFRYVAARTVEQALQLKAEHGDEARFLAGGQSLVPTMNFRLTQPAMLIDINPLAELAGVKQRRGKRLRIGALTRYRDAGTRSGSAAHLPLIAEALPHIAHPQIRNRGTIGGNLAHADPASEMPAIVVALGGRLRAQSVQRRTVD